MYEFFESELLLGVLIMSSCALLRNASVGAYGYVVLLLLLIIHKMLLKRSVLML